MNRPQDPPAATIPAIPTFEALAADPEIAALLDFEPVVRKVKRPDGWTPPLQRELIARLAATGTLQAAVWQMGKHATGAQALYKVASADSFRASWDAAIAIGRRRNGLDPGPPHAAPVPGISRRSGPAAYPRPDPAAANDDDDGAGMDEDDKLLLLERLAAKFLGKVVQERECRLAGEIAAADFYLRQVTALEIGFDLLAEGRAMDAMDALHALRRGGHRLTDIADTPFSRFLDGKRRDYWASDGGPMRPPNLREEWLIDRGDHRIDPGDSATGPASTPARGYGQADWAALPEPDRRDLKRQQYEQDAHDQIAFETAARSEYEARRKSLSRDGRG